MPIDTLLFEAGADGHAAAPAPRRATRDRSPNAARRPTVRLHSLVMSCIALVDIAMMAMVLHGCVGSLTGAAPDGIADASLAFVALGVAVGVAVASYAPLYSAHQIIQWRAASMSAFLPFIAGLGAVIAALLECGVPVSFTLQTGIMEILAGSIFILLSRWAWMQLLCYGAQAGFLAYRVAVVGPDAEAMAARLKQSRSPFIETLRIPNETSADRPGAVRTVIAFARRQSLDAIILAYAPHDTEALREAFLGLRSVVPDILSSSQIAQCGALPISHPLAQFPLTPLQRTALRARDIVLKGMMDRLGGVLLLVLLAPLFMATAIAIRLESHGPVFFVQPRVGYNNRIFMMFKFRSMYHHARDSRARTQTTRHDPRVTRVGRFIRRWSLDELPQILNVISGEMSLVGPRPHAPGTSVEGVLLNRVSEDYDLRHRVLPGINGLGPGQRFAWLADQAGRHRPQGAPGSLLYPALVDLA